MKRFAVILVLAALPALAGEYAVLSSGYRLHAERHEVDGGNIRLFENGGVTVLAVDQIRSFEVEEYTPPPRVPATPEKPASAPQLSTRELITTAAKKHGLPPALVHSVVAAESGYRTDAVSPKGAIGLMQLMPATAKTLGADPKVPEQNVDAGAEYLRELLLKYDGHSERALAAYNAGPGAVDRYKGVPPYRETRAYVSRVLRTYDKLQK